MAQVKVTGVVDKPLGDSGFTLIETVRVESTGQSWEKKWKVWTKDTIPAFSSTVTVVGELSAKLNEYEWEGETRRVVDLNVNVPTITLVAAPVATAPDTNFGAPF